VERSGGGRISHSALIQIPAFGLDAPDRHLRASDMNHDETAPISIVALRADAYSPDGRSVIISLTTKFSTAERKYSVPLECFHDLIVDLQRLNASAGATSVDTSIEPALARNAAE
jgi:hypothetical protein